MNQPYAAFLHRTSAPEPEYSADYFLTEFRCRTLILIASTGQILYKTGEPLTDEDSLSALTSGIFTASQSLFKLLGEDCSPIVTHEGGQNRIHLSPLSPQIFLALILSPTTAVGFVQFKLRLHRTALAEFSKKFLLEKPVTNEEKRGSSIFSEEEIEGFLRF